MRPDSERLLRASVVVLVALAWSSVGVAQESDAEAVRPEDEEVSVDELKRMIREQQKKLEEQSRQIEAQQAEIDSQREILQALQTQIDQIASAQEAKLTEESVKIRNRLQELEATVAQEADRPTDVKAADDLDFPGSIRIPGTNAAIKFGGWVKATGVRTFDPLGTDDRFVTASIPTEDVQAGDANRYELTVNQSRFNIDTREATSGGQLRAFIEGDFAGSGNTYRLRHAYGQWRNVLIGQAWSTFVDDVVFPDDIDFEGLNGRINVRQPLIRYTGAFHDWRYDVALEDPEADIANGEGVARVPSLVARVRRTRPREGHIQGSLLLREIRGQSNANPDVTDNVYGWALSFSRKFTIDWWNEKDRFLVQLNAGDGIGRYVNDLDADGGQDGEFNEETGELEIFWAYAGYVSFQHWWTPRARSTWVYSWVNVNTAAFQSGDSYDSTARATVNFLYSPIPRIDLGAEILWGRREDKDGASGTAMQSQVAVKYKF